MLSKLIRLAVPAVLLMILTSVVHGTDDSTADSILIRSLGGPKAIARISKIKTTVSEGLISLNGQPGHFRQLFKAPDKMRLDVDFGAFKIIQGYDGITAWQTDLTGTTTELQGFERDEIVKNLYFESVSYLMKDRIPGGYDYLGIDTIENEQYHKIAFYPAHIDTVLVYYNLTDSAKSRTLDNLDNMKVVTTVSDQEEVEGVLIPFSSISEIEEAGMLTEMVVESYNYDLPLEDSLFQIPTTVRNGYYFPDSTDFLILPLDYINGHLRVTAHLNGKKMWFILDSGASATLLNRASVAELGLKKVGALPARGVGGFAEVDLVKLDSLNIGEITLFDLKAGVLDLSQLDRRVLPKGLFGGLIGYDFLSKLPLEIDYNQPSITLFKPGSFQPPQGIKPIDFVLTSQVPTIEASVNGHSGKFLIDLGNALGFIAHHQFVSETKLARSLSDIQESTRRFAGITGSMSARTGMCDSVNIADIRLDSIRLILPDSAGGVSGSDQLSGTIGNLVLQNFKILLDYGSKKIWLLPPSSQ
ncbi:MAG: aspartyl protease family protein [bacterium]|nr:aspartyl protease family protein [bacterium]